MSHRSLAAVWAQLELRIDIDNIVCELIGQHTLEVSALQAGSSEQLGSSLRLAILLKVLFDLQRAYPQPPPSTRCPPYLLQPRRLFLAIVHLLSTKSTVLPSSDDSHREYRAFFAMVLVSGLRTLSLRMHQLPPDEASHLQAAFDKAWGKERHLSLVDTFLIRVLCPRMLNQLCQSPAQLSRPACGDVASQDYAAGLASSLISHMKTHRLIELQYPLQNTRGELTETVRRCLQSLDGNVEWEKPYWTLFDVVWMIEAACVQLCVNRGKGARPTRDDQDDLLLIRNQIFGPLRQSRLSSIRSDSIANILFARCVEPCNCLADPPAPSTQASSRTTVTHPLRRGFLASTTVMSEIIDNSLRNLTQSLKSRKETTWNSNGELSDLSDELDDCVSRWYGDAADIHYMTRGNLQIRRGAYILPCPEIHPVPRDILRGLIESSDGRQGLQELDNDESLLQVEIDCPRCPSRNVVSCARGIEPLHSLSSILINSLEREVPIQHEYYREITSSDSSSGISATSSSAPSSLSRVSASTSQRDGNILHEEGKLDEIVGADHLKQFSVRTAPSYAFFANGHSLLLWFRNATLFVAYDIGAKQAQAFHADQPIIHAAAGATLCAFLSSSGTTSDLRVYRINDGTLTSAAQRTQAAVYCVSFSRDDRFVAVGSASEVRIYDVESQEFHPYALRQFRLAKQKKDLSVDSQRICFSADSQKFVIVTRYVSGHVVSFVGDCTATGRSLGDRQLQIFKIETGYPNDMGLTSVHFDEAVGLFCVTAFTSKGPVAALGLGTKSELQNLDSGPLGTQIQCSAQTQTASGFRIALVNNQNEIFTAECQEGTVNQVKKIASPWPRKSSATRNGEMTITMPDDETMHVFWIDLKDTKKTWTLTTFTTRNGWRFG